MALYVFDPSNPPKTSHHHGVAKMESHMIRIGYKESICLDLTSISFIKHVVENVKYWDNDSFGKPESALSSMEYLVPGDDIGFAFLAKDGIEAFGVKNLYDVLAKIREANVKIKTGVAIRVFDKAKRIKYSVDVEVKRLADYMLKVDGDWSPIIDCSGKVLNAKYEKCDKNGTITTSLGAIVDVGNIIAREPHLDLESRNEQSGENGQKRNS